MERIRRFFRRFGKGLKAKGYPLLEVAAVVAVTGTLSAVALPIVSDKIVAGKISAATSDVQAIRDAITSFMSDTGIPPIYSDTDVSSGVSRTLPVETSVTYQLLATNDGIAINFGAPNTGTGWSAYAPLDATKNPEGYTGTPPIGSLDGQIIADFPNYPRVGNSPWKGPYLPSLKMDPWGNKYYVTTLYFGQDRSATPTAKAVYVISAGPNGILDTPLSNVVKNLYDTGSTSSNAPSTFTPKLDDIVARIK